MLKLGKILFSVAAFVAFLLTGKGIMCRGIDEAFRENVKFVVTEHLKERYGEIAKRLEEVLINSIPNKEKRKEFVKADKALRDLITRDGEPFCSIFKADAKTLCNVLLEWYEAHGLFNKWNMSSGFFPHLRYVEAVLQYLKSPARSDNDDSKDNGDLKCKEISELIKEGFIRYDEADDTKILFNPSYILNDEFIQKLSDLF